MDSKYNLPIRIGNVLGNLGPAVKTSEEILRSVLYCAGDAIKSVDLQQFLVMLFTAAEYENTSSSTKPGPQEMQEYVRNGKEELHDHSCNFMYQPLFIP